MFGSDIALTLGESTAAPADKNADISYGEVPSEIVGIDAQTEIDKLWHSYMADEMNSNVGSPLGSELLAAPRPAVYSDSDGPFEAYPELHKLNKEFVPTDVDYDDWLHPEIDSDLPSPSEVSNL
jgi:hypothetical protein